MLVNNTVDYIKSLGNQMSEATTKIQSMAHPFCLFSVLYKGNKPVDLFVIIFNPAFNKMVDSRAKTGHTISEIAGKKVLKYWLDKIVMVELTGREYHTGPYHSIVSKQFFSDVTAFPFPLFNKQAVCLYFTKSVINNSVDSTDLCIGCVNNPSCKVPTVKMGKIEGELGLSDCDVCRLARSLSLPDDV